MNYESMPIQFPSDRTKIGGVTSFLDTSWFFVTQPIFSYDLNLSRYNLETEARSPKLIIFFEFWVRKDSVGTSPEKFLHWKFSGTERYTKKFRFSLISLAASKKKVSGSCTHNFDATDLPNS